MERRHLVAGSAFGAVASTGPHAETSGASAWKVRDQMEAPRVAESACDNVVHAIQAAPAAPRR